MHTILMLWPHLLQYRTARGATARNYIVVKASPYRLYEHEWQKIKILWKDAWLMSKKKKILTLTLTNRNYKKRLISKLKYPAQVHIL